MRLVRRRDLARHRPEVEDRLRQRDPGLSVERGVVHLRVQRHLAVGEALDHRELPQRALAIQRLRMQLRHQRLELALAARLGQARALDVVVEIDLAGLDPYRVAKVQRHQGEATGENRREVHAPGDVLAHARQESAAQVRRTLEAAQAAHVHQRFRRLYVEEAGVESAQCLQGHAAPWFMQPGGAWRRRGPRSKAVCSCCSAAWTNVQLRREFCCDARLPTSEMNLGASR